LKSFYRYEAFLSYAHEDEITAQWLEHMLARTWVPFRLSRRIYRDRTHLRAGPLKAEIKEAVCASKFLIVCCSAHSSQSKWVQEEINLFLQARPEAKAKILLCRVGSKEGSDAESLTPIAQLVGNESFVPDVRGYAPTATRKELRAFHFEALSLLAPLLQLPDKQAVAAVIRRRLVVTATIFLACALVASSVWAMFRWTTAGSLFLIRRELRAHIVAKDIASNQMPSFLVVLGFAHESICTNGPPLLTQYKTGKRYEWNWSALAAESLFAAGDRQSVAKCNQIALAIADAETEPSKEWEALVEQLALTGEPAMAERVIEKIRVWDRSLPMSRGDSVPILRSLLLTAEGYYQEGRTRQAAMLLNLALRENDTGEIARYRYDDTYVHTLIARAQFNTGDPEGAADTLRKLWMQRAPRNVQDFHQTNAQWILASLAAVGKWHEAYQMLHTIPNNGFSPEADIAGVLNRVALEAAKAGDAEFAERVLDEAMSIRGGTYFSEWIDVAVTLSEAARPNEAAKVMEKLDSAAQLMINAPNPWVAMPPGRLFMLGWALLGDQKRAMQWFKASTRHDDRKPRLSPDPSLAIIYAVAGQLPEAKIAADNDPDISGRVYSYVEVLDHYIKRRDARTRERWKEIEQLRLPDL
jgi:tetratricopeptide (TPR) repeat protein